MPSPFLCDDCKCLINWGMPMKKLEYEGLGNLKHTLYFHEGCHARRPENTDS